MTCGGDGYYVLNECKFLVDRNVMVRLSDMKPKVGNPSNTGRDLHTWLLTAQTS